MISIVLPIYNVEEYISRCLDSVITQTYDNIEVILVDDGSPDNAGAICDQYAEQDSRIKVFHIPNGGVAKARQYGFKQSSGEYIVFADPDDWLPSNAIEVLYSNLSDDIDIVIGSNYKVRGSYKSFCKLKNKIYSHNEYLAAAISFSVVGYPWGRLFRRSLFTAESFYNLPRAQDWVMNIDIAIRCRAVKTIVDNTYYYVANSGASTFKRFTPEFEYYKTLCFAVKDILIGRGLYEENKVYYAISAVRIFNALIYRNAFIDTNDTMIIEALDILKGKRLSLVTRIQCVALKNSVVALMLQIIFSIKNIVLRG